MDHESEVVKAFFLPAKRERYLEFLTNPKRRRKLIAELAHFGGLDPRWCVEIPPSLQRAESIEDLLHRRGAGPLCWVISERSQLDGRQMGLGEALDAAVGGQMGTILSCIPGELGYFEDEEKRWILQRKQR